MKRICLILVAVNAAFGGCLTVDSLTIKVPACLNGSCQSGGPGVTTKEQLIAAMTWQVAIEGHNACKLPIGRTSKVDVSFYDADGFRIGLTDIYVEGLAASEKFRHTYQIPDNVVISGKPTIAKVRKVEEAFVGTINK